MTGWERMRNILKRQKTDRIGLYEHFWEDTRVQWRAEGKIGQEDLFSDHFGFDMDKASAFNMTADIDFIPVKLEENEDTVVTRDGNGATLRRHKRHDTTPEHIDFRVKDHRLYLESVKPLLKPDRRRIDFEGYRRMKRHAAEKQRFFFWTGLNSFECMHPVCGHETMLAAMALEPEWIKEMALDYARLTVDLQQILFAEEGNPDGIWYYEDLGFKEHPFLSPSMYDEILKPAHKHTMDHAKHLGLPVVMHSCGFVEPLLPSLIDAGIDALQVIEVKAGMDLLRLFRKYGDRLSLIGGLDVRTLCSNDWNAIDEELEAKVPTVKQGCGYVLHSDHSIPKTVRYDTYMHFIEKGLALGRL